MPLPAECSIKYRLPAPCSLDVSEQPTHDVELVIARENLLALLLSAVRVRDLDDLGVVLNDVGQAVTGENLLPQIVRLEAVRVWWVARAVVPALVERQKPRSLALQLVQNRTSLSSTAKCTMQRPNWNSSSRGLRSRLYCSTASSTVCLVRLFFSSNVAIGRPVDEQAQIERVERLVGAVAQLPRHGEAVCRVALFGLGVAGRRRAVEQFDCMRAVLHALAAARRSRRAS